MAVETTPGDLPLASLKQELIDSLPEGKEWTNSDTCVRGNLMFLTIEGVDPDPDLPATVTLSYLATVLATTNINGTISTSTSVVGVSGTLTKNASNLYDGTLTVSGVSNIPSISVVNGVGNGEANIDPYVANDSGWAVTVTPETITATSVHGSALAYRSSSVVYTLVGYTNTLSTQLVAASFSYSKGFSGNTSAFSEDAASASLTTSGAENVGVTGGGATVSGSGSGSFTDSGSFRGANSADRTVNFNGLSKTVTFSIG